MGKMENLFKALNALTNGDKEGFKAAKQEFIEDQKKVRMIVKAGLAQVQIEIREASTSDVRDMASQMIGRLLDLFPSDERNDILLHAIHIPKTEGGTLFEDREEEEDQ